MRTEILLILLFTLLTFTLGLPSADTTPDITQEVDNISLAGGADNGEIESLSPIWSLTGMSDFSGWYKCETSRASPRVVDIRGIAYKLKSMRYQRCTQENSVKSFCTKMVHSGTAAVSICGPYENWIYCYRVAFAANTIADNCEWNGLAGGYFVFDNHGSLTFPIHKN